MPTTSSSSSAPSRASPRRNLPTRKPNKNPVEEEEVEEVTRFSAPLMIPDLFTTPPPVRDALATHTSRLQDETVTACLPFLAGEGRALEFNIHGVARLDRARHVRFLHHMLEPLPERFLAADPSRSWILYWTLAGLTTLGEDVSGYRHRLAQTARGMQNPTGGFGGGGGQLSHLATTYAVVLALALVGGEEAYEVVDREGLWRWLCSLKQKDGGFQVCLGGEEDIRGAYCAAVIITLLNLPLELTPESPAYTPDGSTNLLSGLADYVRRCQTFEGGISGQPNVEAHGAYAFCALGCLSVLGDPRRIIPEYLDIPRLTAWLSSRQYAPEGGFSGRTNKLIDGCYSHWVGGCFPLIEAALGVGADGNSIPGSLPPPAETLFSREGLTRYILCCCQDQTRRGGLRDKPGKMSDAYHTCYVLAGLSSAQHQWELSTNDTNIGATLGATGADAVWNVLPYLGGDDDLQVFEREDLVRPVHPVYAIPLASKDAMRSYFLAKGSSFDDDGAAATAPGE